MGGGVRDMLLGREPKDFDVTTDARPEEVRSLFRNCRLVGRRFRLAHVMFGRETIEVATFRGPGSEAGDGGVEVEENGRIVRDNVWGTLEEDAWRRDFTVNALYYNIQDFSVVDYTGGMEDLQAGLLRTIGDARQRYREDPVRMLRAVRFAAKIGFRLHPSAEQALFELGHLLADMPPARLFDEVLKLFMGGCALQTFELLRHYRLFEHLFPATEVSLAEEDEGFPIMMLAQALKNTDMRVAEDKPVTPAFLYAALLWEPVRLEWRRLMDEGESEQAALVVAASSIIDRQLDSTALPRRFSTPMQEIWHLQPRLVQRKAKQVIRLSKHPRFRAAYDFMLLRGEVGEVEEAVCEWWTRYQEVDEDEQARMIRTLSPGPRRRRGRGRRVGRQTAHGSE